MSTKKTISKSEYYQLVGLVALGATHLSAMTDIEHAAMGILGETDDMGHASDIVWGSRDLDEGLRIMEITVTEA